MSQTKETLIKESNGYSIVEEIGDDGQIEYVIYGPNGEIDRCSTQREAEAVFDKETAPKPPRPPRQSL
jgi:hypothetical protein